MSKHFNMYPLEIIMKGSHETQKHDWNATVFFFMLEPKNHNTNYNIKQRYSNGLITQGHLAVRAGKVRYRLHTANTGSWSSVLTIHRDLHRPSTPPSCCMMAHRS